MEQPGGKHLAVRCEPSEPKDEQHVLFPWHLIGTLQYSYNIPNLPWKQRGHVSVSSVLDTYWRRRSLFMALRTLWLCCWWRTSRHREAFNAIIPPWAFQRWGRLLAFSINTHHATLALQPLGTKLIAGIVTRLPIRITPGRFFFRSVQRSMRTQ